MLKEIFSQSQINNYDNTNKFYQETTGQLYTKQGLKEERSSKCMQFLKDNYGQSNIAYIKFKPHRGFDAYKAEEIDKWLNFIKFNFKLSFEFDGTWFTIDKSEVKSVFKMYITLILIRYLWYPTSNIIEETYRILEMEPDLDPFKALLLAHYNRLEYEDGTFRLFSPKSIFYNISTDEFLKDLEYNEKAETTFFACNLYFSVTLSKRGYGNLYNCMNSFVVLLIRKYYKDNKISKIFELYNKLFKLYNIRNGKMFWYETSVDNWGNNITDEENEELLKHIFSELGCKITEQTIVDLYSTINSNSISIIQKINKDIDKYLFAIPDHRYVHLPEIIVNTGIYGYQIRTIKGAHTASSNAYFLKLEELKNE